MIFRIIIQFDGGDKASFCAEGKSAEELEQRVRGCVVPSVNITVIPAKKKKED